MKAASSIRRELLLSLFGSLVLLYAIGAITIYIIVQQSIYRKFDQSLRQKLLDFAAETIVIEGRDTDMPRLSVHDFFESEFCQLRDDTGQVLAASKTLNGNDLPIHRCRRKATPVLLSSSQEILDGKRGKIGYIWFQPKLIWRHPVEQDHLLPISVQNDAQMHLAIAMPTADEQNTLRILAFTLLITGAFMGGAIYLIVQMKVKNSLRPLDNVVRLTGSIQPNELSRRLPCGELPSELSPLVKQFNTLLDRLEAAFDRERSFSASLGHEIRTPLTELNALLGNAIYEFEQNEPARQTLNDANDICHRMAQLIEVISSVHHAESGRQLIHRESIDPAEILDAVITAKSDDIENADLRIEIHDSRETVNRQLENDRVIVHAILQNYIANAIDYSLPNTTVECRLMNRADISKQVITITNTPADLSSDDMPHLSEPFWRKDVSRCDRGKYGLGLSIVEVYAKLLDAKTEYELKDGKFIATLEIGNQESSL